MGLIKRWIIERYMPADGEDWDIVGSVLGSWTAEQAIAKARTTIPHIQAETRIRARDWWKTSEEDREAASYEDQMDNRGMGGFFASGVDDTSGAPTEWERDYVAGDLPVGVNTAGRALAYRLIALLLRSGKRIVIIAVIIILVRIFWLKR